LGFFEDVVDMPNQYEYSLEFFERFYRPEYSTIIVVGDVTKENVNTYAEKYFGNWKRGSYQPTIEQEPLQNETRFVHIKHPSFPPYLGLSYKGPAFSDGETDFAAITILTTYLFTENSELYQRLVIKEQKVRTIENRQLPTRDPFLINIGASVVNAADLQYVKDEIQKALQTAASQPIDVKKLRNTKSHLKYNFAMGLDNPDAIANAIAQYTWLTGNPESLNKYYAIFERVTAEDISRVAKKYFTPSTLTIATITPGEGGSVQ
jgi:zinc protease